MGRRKEKVLSEKWNSNERNKDEKRGRNQYSDGNDNEKCIYIYI